MSEPIDVHTFIGDWIGTEGKFSSTVTTLLSAMRKAGISHSVAMTTNSDQNESVRRIVKEHHDSLYFAMWFVPDQSHLDYLREHREEIKLVKIHPSHTRTRLDDPKMKPVVEFCEENDLPILVHCGRWREVSGYDAAMNVAETCDGTILLAHMGGVDPSLVISTVDSLRDGHLKNVYLVTSGMAISENSYKLGGCPPSVIRYAVEGVGSDRVLLGSDFPFGSPLEMLDSVLAANLGLGDFRRITHDNAVQILRL